MSILEEISCILLGDLPLFLDSTSLKMLSPASKTLHSLVNPHISNNIYFMFTPTLNPTLISPQMVSTRQHEPNLIHQFFNIYKPKRFHLGFPEKYEEYRILYLAHLPAYITHLKFCKLPSYTDSPLNLILPPSLKYFSCNMAAKTPHPMFNSLINQADTANLLLHMPLLVTQIYLYSTDFNRPLDNLPPHLTHLDLDRLAGRFNKNLDNLPKTLTHLVLSYYFNKSIDSLPPGLTHLYFGEDFDQPVDNLPKSLYLLRLGYNFQQKLENLPPSLRQLQLQDTDFRLSVLLLPDLTHLECGKLLNLSLPTSLRVLVVSETCIIDKQLPPNLIYLDLNAISQDLQYLNSLESLKILEISHYGDWDLTAKLDYLPKNLVSLHCNKCKLTSIDHLPISLKKLNLYSTVVDSGLDHLPDNLTYLRVHKIYNVYYDNLPSSLTYLCFDRGFEHSVDHFPASLSHLKIFSDSFNEPLDNLPPFLRRLEIEGEQFNQFVDHLPKSLCYLDLGERFNKPLDNLPPSLTHLYINPNGDFNKYVDHLPPLLTKLSLPDQFDMPLDNLPKSLTHLKLGPEYIHPLDHLPPSLFHLFCELDKPLHYPPPCCAVHHIHTHLSHNFFA